MTISEFFNVVLPHTKAEAFKDVAALSFIASPAWLPLLRETSELAALLMPIAGVVWLGVQIGVKLHTTYWKKK